MVKNLPTVERSTKIRFGKNVPDSDVQAENTIIINASNTLVTTPNSGSIYMSPVRFRNDLVDPNIVLMMYNRVKQVSCLNRVKVLTHSSVVKL